MFFLKGLNFLTFGRIVLLILEVLIIFGLGQRVLDRMRLSDRAAMIWMALVLIGGWLPSIPITPMFSINIGGAIIPVILSVYVWIRAETAWKKCVRCLPQP